VGPLQYDNNRNVLNKCDDEVQWWLSLGRPKVTNSSGNSPGAAAPGNVLLQFVQNHYFSGLVQPVGLVDYESLKKSTWRFLLFSRRCSKEFTDATEMSSSDKLFQLFMTHYEKDWSRVSRVVIMVPIWRCVGLTSIWSNFSDLHYNHTHFFKLFTFVLLNQQSPSHRGIDSTRYLLEPNPAICYLSDMVFNFHLIKWSWFW